MTGQVTGPKRIVVRANRETVGLIAAAAVATFALGSVVHSRPPEQVAAETSDVPQDWAGHLADVASEQVQTASVEPMTSASLVVPKSALALPSVQARPKGHGCDSTSCPPKVTLASAEAPVSLPERAPPAAPARKERSLMSRLNPLNHMPDMRTLGRPFTYAGNAISDWVRNF